MAKLEQDKLINLLEAGNVAGAKQLFTQFISTELDQEEVGRAYVDLALVYIRFENVFNEELSRFFTESINKLRDLQGLEQKLEQASDLADVRKKLST